MNSRDNNNNTSAWVHGQPKPPYQRFGRTLLAVTGLLASIAPSFGSMLLYNDTGAVKFEPQIGILQPITLQGAPNHRFDYAVQIDLDGDGVRELITGNAAAAGVSVYQAENNTAYRFQRTLPFAAARRAATGDVNGDGYPDLVLAGVVGEQDRVYLGTPQGLSQHARLFGPLHSEQSTALLLGDLNQDGIDEILVGREFSATSYYFYAAETNTFQARKLSGIFDARGFAYDPRPQQQHPVALIASSLGLFQLSASNHQTFSVSKLLSGNFNSVAVSDINGDGYADIAVTTTTQAKNRVPNQLPQPNVQVLVGGIQRMALSSVTLPITVQKLYPMPTTTAVTATKHGLLVADAQHHIQYIASLALGNAANVSPDIGVSLSASTTLAQPGSTFSVNARVGSIGDITLPTVTLNIVLSGENLTPSSFDGCILLSGRSYHCILNNYVAGSTTTFTFKFLAQNDTLDLHSMTITATLVAIQNDSNLNNNSDSINVGIAPKIVSAGSGRTGGGSMDLLLLALLGLGMARRVRICPRQRQR